MSLIQRFLLGNRVEDDLQVGLFLKNDGTVWLRNPDGSETQVDAGASAGVATIQAQFETLLQGGTAVRAAMQAAFVIGPSASNIGDFHAPVAACPTLCVAADNVVSSPLVTVHGIPDDSDDYIGVATIYVSNADGTEVLEVGASFDIPPHTASGSVDWSTASANPVAGTDLSWDGSSNIVTAAGGIFWAYLIAFGNWS